MSPYAAILAAGARAPAEGLGMDAGAALWRIYLEDGDPEAPPPQAPRGQVTIFELRAARVSGA